MAIKISGTTVIDDSRNIKNVTNMYQGTSDGSDTSLVTINGGGGGPNWSRGAGISVYGNEHATEPGLAWLYGGNVTGSEVRLAAGGSTRLSINGDTGAWNINSVSNPGTAGQVLTSQGSGAPPGWGSPFGLSQTWSRVQGSRSFGTNYQNTTSLPIMVHVRKLTGTAGMGVYLGATTGAMSLILASTGMAYATIEFIVPVNWYYRVECTDSINVWSELR
jgi:hypothetical protein